MKRVKDEVGIDLRIISGKEEAELALKSCVPLISQDAEVAVVFDIGGGSTEVSVIKVADLEPFWPSQIHVQAEPWFNLTT